MFFYWLLFAFPVAMAFIYPRINRSCTEFSWNVSCIILIFIVGFRYQVGGDWYSYIEYYLTVKELNFVDSLGVGDPAYSFFNWVSVIVGGDILLVNVFCSIICVTGLFTFCKHQPFPWLAMAISIPYLVIVVYMGFTRQSVAIGFWFYALVLIMQGHIGRSVLLILVASLFHKSAIFLIIFVLLQENRKSVILLLIFSALLFFQFEKFQFHWDAYVGEQINSDGSFIRVLMNAAPASVYLVFKNQLSPSKSERHLFTTLAFASIILFFLVQQAPAAVDRLSFYMIPVQIYVLSRVALLFKNPFLKTLSTFSVVAYYSFVLWYWMVYSSHSYGWIPYQLNLYI